MKIETIPSKLESGNSNGRQISLRSSSKVRSSRFGHFYKIWKVGNSIGHVTYACINLPDFSKSTHSTHANAPVMSSAGLQVNYFQKVLFVYPLIKEFEWKFYMTVCTAVQKNLSNLTFYFNQENKLWKLCTTTSIFGFLLNISLMIKGT